MYPGQTSNRRYIVVFSVVILIIFLALTGRVAYLMLYRSDYYSQLAEDLHQRERSIKAARGIIYDTNGIALATNRTVCTVSVIHNQITDADEVVRVLSEELGISEDKIRTSVEKYTSREVIKTNVDKEIGDAIRAYDLDGVKVDEDYKRYYPYGSLASKVIGFTGSDNQGIIGLEVEYEAYLKGTDGTILTLTDAKGIEIDTAGEERIEPEAGDNLYTSIDINIQQYAEQLAYQTMEEHNANSVSITVMNPKTGEILAMVNVPEFDLNDPFTLTDYMVADLDENALLTSEETQDLLNQMWRNGSINDTYEPGSTFKIFTMAAALEEGVVSLNDTFSCPGYRIVADRRIRCHKVAGHGGETFLQGAMNSCNPVFIDVGLRLGTERFYYYLDRLGLLSKTGIDLPGEASTIMHNIDNVKEVELATMSFGQSFQITPVALLSTVSAIINGGTKITPHLAVKAESADGTSIVRFDYATEEGVISEETSELVRYILEQVVSEGTGKNAKVEGFSIGGKTATSEKLPRSSNKYISSFIGFAPADDPQVIALITIDEPEGTYYGGTIAAPVIGELFDNILPYLGIEKVEEVQTDE